MPNFISFIGDSKKRWHYDPEDQLGKSGGFGSVFAGHGDDGTPCAVKVLSDTASDLPERLRLRETEIAKRLREYPSQHLVQILDVAPPGDPLRIVMERAGESLSGVIRTLDEAGQIAALGNIALGLQELHERGIIHRDLKPSNILHQDERWKLADFGIAHDTEVGTQTYTFAGLVGTWAYVAPELFSPAPPTPKSDLYALGCIAFEMVAGHRPFSGESWSECGPQHLQAKLPELPADANPVLRSLIRRLLAKSPAERPQDARAVAETLGTIPAQLSRSQKRLIDTATQFVDKFSDEAAAQAATEAKTKLEKDAWQQSFAELSSICDIALLTIQSTLPNVHLSRKSNYTDDVIVIENQDARLEIEVWTYDLSANDLRAVSPLTAVGMVHGKNRRSVNWAKRDEETQPQYPARLSNIVAQFVNGRIEWKQYRFRCRNKSRSYLLGPTDREHGLKYRYFFDCLPFMNRQEFFGASVQIEPLTVDSIVDYFAEALALPADAYALREAVGPLF
jgi:serine/threonine protein kinase